MNASIDQLSQPRFEEYTRSSGSAILMLPMLLLLLAAAPVFGHSKTTHQTLADYAAQKAASLTTPVTFTATQRSLLQQGAKDEDIPLTRTLNHAYNPVSGGSFPTGTTARNEISTRWTSMLNAFAAGNVNGGDESGAWHYLGRVSHLMQDMTSPLHAFAVEHAPCQFEKYWEANDSTLRSAISSIGGPLHSSTLDAKATEKLDSFSTSRLHDRFNNSSPNKGSDDPRGWVETMVWSTYFRATLWGQVTMGSSSGNGAATSSTTTSTTFSDGTVSSQANVLDTMFGNGNVRWINKWIGDDYFEITDRNGYVFRFMSMTDIDDWAACGQAPSHGGWSYGQKDSSIRVNGSDDDSDGVRVTGRFWFDPRELGKSTSGTTNRYCYPPYYPNGNSMTDHLHQYFGNYLHPLTVRYNAGLLGLANRRVTITTGDSTQANGFVFGRADNVGNGGSSFSAGSGGTHFFFVAKSSVTLSAPVSNSGGRSFVRWLRDGSAFSGNTSRTITINDNSLWVPTSGVTYTAEYQPPIYTISGSVRTSGGVGISGVTLSGLPGGPVTDASGYYSASVSSGWSGTATPSKAGYTFNPASRSYNSVTSNQSTHDYTGTPPSYTISGLARTSGGVGIGGVTVSGLPGNPVTDAGGYYSATVTSGWSGTATPSRTGYTFSPPSRTYTSVTSAQSNQDYTGSVVTYTISGHARTSGGVGISGVTLSGLPGNPVTDASGYYTASVSSGWSGTATPSKAGYTLSPPSRTYNNVTSNQSNQDYTGTLPPYTISGLVRTSGGVAISGVTLSGLPGNPVTDANGYYSASVSSGWSGTATPSKAGYTLSPPSRIYNNVTSNESNQDYTGTPPPYTISGHMRTSGGVGISGVTLTGLPGNPVTDTSGYYSASVSSGWSGTATPSKAGYTFSPVSRAYNNVSSNHPDQNYVCPCDGEPARFEISQVLSPFTACPCAIVPIETTYSAVGTDSWMVVAGWVDTTGRCANPDPVVLYRGKPSHATGPFAISIKSPSAPGCVYTLRYCAYNQELSDDAAKARFRANEGQCGTVAILLVRSDCTPWALTTVVWRHAETGELGRWGLDQAGVMGYHRIAPKTDLNWDMVGVADFDCDGDQDVLWRQRVWGEVGYWVMDGDQPTGYRRLGSADQMWRIVGTGDVNCDGKVDVVWRESATGALGFWLMDCGRVLGFQYIGRQINERMATDLSWDVVGVADLDCDGKTEIVWRSQVSGRIGYWKLNCGVFSGYQDVSKSSDTAWSLAALGDFDCDGKMDMLWRHRTSGEVGFWKMNCGIVEGYRRLSVQPDLKWIITGAAPAPRASDCGPRTGVPAGTKLWEFQTQDQALASPAVGNDCMVYIGSTGGKMYAIDGLTGIGRWEFTTGGPISYSSAAIGRDGTVYFGSHDRRVYALDGARGTKRWEFATGDSVASSPAIGADGTVYVGSNDRNVYALDSVTGAIRWSFARRDPGGTDKGDSSPSIGRDGTVYIGSVEGRLYALAGATGAKRWEFATGGAVVSSPAIGADGTVYFGSHDGKVYGVDGATGAKKWEYDAKSVVACSPALGTDGTLYFGSLKANETTGFKLYALNGSTGAERWTWSAGDGVYSSPALGLDGALYAGNYQGRLDALNSATGNRLWYFTIGAPTFSSPTIGPDGTVYVAGHNGKVFAIQGNAAGGPAASPWPMFRQNARHTGRAE
ncbi:MAG: hypothetical protein FJ387_27915 [Verrucomicrobia bacterium]|nr:hypothetical protein [Verrucomicrobiota bacterium]